MNAAESDRRRGSSQCVRATLRPTPPSPRDQLQPRSEAPLAALAQTVRTRTRCGHGHDCQCEQNDTEGNPSGPLAQTVGGDAAHAEAAQWPNGYILSLPHPGRRKPGHCYYSPRPPPPFFRSRSRQLGSESRPGGGGQRSSKSMRMGRYSSWNLPARGLTHPGGIALPKRPLPHPYDTQIRTLVAFPPAHYPIVCLCLPVAARPAALCPRAHTGGDPVTNSPRPPSTAFDKW